MKILYLHNSDIASEAANLVQVISMCNAFSRINNNVILVLNSTKNISQDNIHEIIKKKMGTKPDFKIILHTSISAKYSRLGKYFDYYYYKNLIKSINPDFCYIRHHLIIKSCIKGGIPFYFEIHNANYYTNSRIINKLWTKKVIRASKSPYLLKIVVISEKLKKVWVNKNIASSKIIVLHDGFNRHLFENEISQYDARELLSLPCNKKIAVYTGSLYPDREIENIMKLALKIPKTIFIVIGGPKKNAEYYRKVSNDNGIKNIVFLGQKNHHEIPLYLFAADVLLALWSRKVPTINYCSPLKVFEYMAAGRIIVAHAFPTITEVLKNNNNSFLVNPDSFDELLQKTKEALLFGYPNEISQNARILAFSRYTWNERAKIIMKELKNENG